MKILFEEKCSRCGLYFNSRKRLTKIKGRYLCGVCKYKESFKSYSAKPEFLPLLQVKSCPKQSGLTGQEALYSQEKKNSKNSLTPSPDTHINGRKDD